MNPLELMEQYESLVAQLARYETEMETLQQRQQSPTYDSSNDQQVRNLQARITNLLAEKGEMEKEKQEVVAKLIETQRLLEDEKRRKKDVLELRVILPDGNVRTTKGVFHPQFKRLFQLASARMNILLVGPAGSGKTHVCAQIAEALGLPFGFISCSAGMSEGQLTGRLVPTGKGGSFQYLRSEFVRCYEEGGVFLFDEIDAADSNTLLVINSALANGHMAVANRPENPVAEKHPDFICVAAANTFGTGADRQYVGRNQLDESTLDRFRIGQVEIDYSPEVEEQICPDTELRTRLQSIRAKVRQTKLRRVVSTRFLRDAYRMKQAGWISADIESALMAGWTADEVAKVRGTF